MSCLPQGAPAAVCSLTCAPLCPLNTPLTCTIAATCCYVLPGWLIEQCLYSNGGYTYLDVRSALEVDEVGKVKDSVNIPFVICTRVYDAQEGKKVIKKENNADFIAQVCACGMWELVRPQYGCSTSAVGSRANYCTLSHMSGSPTRKSASCLTA